MPRKSQLKQISYRDVPQFIKDLHKKNGISRELFMYRINKGNPRLDMYVAATRKPRKDGNAGPSKFAKEREICKQYDVPFSTFYSRVKLGWKIEHACTLPVDRTRVLSDEDLLLIKEKGLYPRLVRQRMDAGWSKEKAINTPKVHARFYGEHNPYVIRAEENGISQSTYFRRVNGLGWTNEQACTIPLGGGKEFTIEQNKQFLSLGLHINTVRNRIDFHKWDVWKAVSTPYMSVEGVK